MKVNSIRCSLCRYLRRDISGCCWCVKGYDFKSWYRMVCCDFKSYPFRYYYHVVYMRKYNRKLGKWVFDPDETVFHRLEKEC